ncbi:MAG: hypothetical protein HYT14_02735 [Candidatus Liptonbacteria bacterium]|nr:hypothetical protein [Candidatus Liptonbacteria bacterium]
MAKGFVTSRKNLTRDTLLRLAFGTVSVGMAASAPYLLHQIAEAYFKDKTKKALADRSRKLRELEQRKLISFEEGRGGTVRVEFTRKGKMLVRQYELDDLKLQVPKQWDKKWRLVIYDIPHGHKTARDAFRNKINQMGLYPLQKSVWVSPFECRDELEFLCDVFSISFDSYFCYVVAQTLPHEQRIKNFFGLA